MFALINFNNRISKFLSISLLVAVLVVLPSCLGKELQLFSASPSWEFSVQAQTPAESESTQQNIKFDIAQAPAASPSSEEKEEEVINFFVMAMGALAGLVLFIFGVTRLSEGLEEIGQIA